MTQDQVVPRNVRAEMARRGVDQAQVALALKTTQQSVSSRLTGKVDFRVGELETIADLLGVPVSTFFAETAVAS